MIALVDGSPASCIPVSDSSVLRGDGCFEAIRSYGGHLFALGDHLDRLARSAALLDLPCPDRGAIERWCDQVAAEGGDGVIRIVLTRGVAIPGAEGGPTCVVIHHPPPPPVGDLRLLPVRAPWHPAGRDWELAGAKTISYAPNLAAGRQARKAGFDDALLISDEDLVLEGPTFTIACASEATVFTPSLDLHVLESITRRFVLDEASREGLPVKEGRFTLGRLLEADEIMAFSTTKEVVPVVRVGERSFSPGPVAGALRARLRERIAQEMRPQGGVGR